MFDDTDRLCDVFLATCLRDKVGVVLLDLITPAAVSTARPLGSIKPATRRSVSRIKSVSIALAAALSAHNGTRRHDTVRISILAVPLAGLANGLFASLGINLRVGAPDQVGHGGCLRHNVSILLVFTH